MAPSSDEMIRWTCLSCNKQLKAARSATGKTIKCPQCGEVTHIPRPKPTHQPPPTNRLLPPDINLLPFLSPAPDQPPAHQHAPSPARTKTCPFCAEPIHVDAKKCKHCGEIIDPTLRSYSPQRQHEPEGPDGVAALISLVLPGGGQIYQGRIGSGFIWMICAFVGYLLLIVPGIIIHIVCIVNAAQYRRG